MLELFLPRLRSAGFWFLDALKGGIIYKSYKSIRAFDNIDSKSSDMENYLTHQVEKLLTYATTHSDFYKSYYGNDLSLYKFPVINKNIIKENYQAFLSKEFKENQLVRSFTSGSTGIPFVAYMNKEKKKRVQAEVIYYTGKAGYRVGDSLIFLRSLNEKTQKSRLHQWLQNENLVDVSRLDDQEIEKILEIIERTSKRGSTLLSYSGTYDILRDYFTSNKQKGSSKIKGMIAISEMLFDDTREVMEEVFKCRCVSRYSNQENGLLGQDEEDNNVFIINEASYLIEIFDLDEDIPAKEGAQGRIVVTDLYNFAMPMIRYDTGDIGSLCYIKRNGIYKKAIKDFGGRRLDVVHDIEGNPLSPHKISVSFANIDGLKQYQFIQEGKKDYLVKLNLEKDFSQKEELENLLRELVGTEAIISFEEVDEIPALHSGKRKYVVNNYKEN